MITISELGNIRKAVVALKKARKVLKHIVFPVIDKDDFKKLDDTIELLKYLSKAFN